MPRFAYLIFIFISVVAIPSLSSAQVIHPDDVWKATSTSHDDANLQQDTYTNPPASPPRPAPALSEVIAHTLRNTSLRDDSLRSRARLRALLPKIAASVGQNYTQHTDQSYRDYLELNAAGNLHLHRAQNSTNDKNDQRFSWKVAVTFDLQPLIFADEEIAIQREQRAQQQDQLKLVQHTTDLYIQWISGETPLEKEIAFQQLVLLTNGWIADFYTPNP